MSHFVEYKQSSFWVHFQGLQSIQVPSGEAILEHALDAGIPIRCGCFYGDCTACVSRMIEGSVEQEQATGLSEQQKEEGLVLLCVAHPTTDCTIALGLTDEDVF